MKQNDEFGFYLKRYKINKKELPNKRVEAERKKIKADTVFLQIPLASPYTMNLH
ncbi:hypothetical protein FOLKNPGA_02764 [Legionella sp. PC1000]|nr:hypothetical protein FOLKNPGA_02764 [Legionella sp. PC1000]